MQYLAMNARGDMMRKEREIISNFIIFLFMEWYNDTDCGTSNFG